MSESNQFQQIMQEGHAKHGINFDGMMAQSLRTILKEGIYEVNFIKKTDGQHRVMHCTLNTDAICEALQCEADEVVDPQIDFKYNSVQVRCFDLDKKAWRCFLVDGDLISVECISALTE